MSFPMTLVVDDDLRMRQLISDTLAEDGLAVRATDDAREALRLIDSQAVDLVITDLKMPHVDGIGVLERAKSVNPDTVVIVVTGYGTIESAVEAIRKGAYDYLQKPFEPDEFMLLFRRAMEHSRLVRRNKELLRELAGCRNDALVGASRAVETVKHLVAQIAPFDTTVLVQGETGTGKELVARLIHEGSARREATFLPVNCGALAESLLEAELFGYEKGAFTGAEKRKSGLFETADKGTIFLDEINATSVNFQVKLLRVLEEGRFLRVGGAEPVAVDVRVVAAANAPLEAEVEAGRFRRDLLYRLNVFTIELPPLRKRMEDLPSLAYYFLARYAAKYGKNVTAVSQDVLRRLNEHSWPGNVRELENVIERAVIMESKAELQAVHLPRGTAKILDDQDLASGLVRLEDMEKALIQRTLRGLQGQKARAAEALGISTTSLWRKIKRYELE
jgi:DNA-binding NtrC family response regulator